jgi:hypothetical protein
VTSVTDSFSPHPPSSRGNNIDKRRAGLIMGRMPAA